MPTYDYACDSCRRTFEVRQPISAAPLTDCQFCGGPVRRLISATPFILKGGGWYVTDYPSESRKKGMESEKKAAPVAGAATSTTASSPATSTSAPPATSSSDAASSAATKD